MRIGLLVNRLETEKAGYTTTQLAVAAAAAGHEVWRFSVDGLACDALGKVSARATLVNAGIDAETLVAQGRDAALSKIEVEHLNAMFLRNDPAEDVSTRPWARLAGINFGRLARERGVTVVNDPDGLAHAVNKMYLHFMPNSVRPRSVITRERAEILAFAEACDRQLIVKPLHGSGGHNVFYLRLDRPENINQILEALLAESYILAQEYLPAAAEGDVRVFVLNGEILRNDGKPAAIRRLRPKGDVRSNISVGATVSKAQVTAEMEQIVESIKPRLLADGMFLVGLDVVDSKLLEVNVFSPGGLFSASRLHGTDFVAPVLAGLEEHVNNGTGGFRGHTKALLSSKPL